VLRPTLVNEFNGGFSLNHYGYRATTTARRLSGSYIMKDLSVRNLASARRANSTPRRDGAATTTEPSELLLVRPGGSVPYVGLRAIGRQTARISLASVRARSRRVMPAQSQHRGFRTTSTKAMGRHSFKFGAYFELDSKPSRHDQLHGQLQLRQPTDQSFDTRQRLWKRCWASTRRSGSQRPLTRMSGSAEQFTPRTSWKMSPALHVDYGVRFTHSGRLRRSTAPPAASIRAVPIRQGASAVRAGCTNPAIQGNQTARQQRAAIDRCS